MMNSERWIFVARVTIAVVLGLWVCRYGESAIAGGNIGEAFMVGALVLVYGVVLFLLFGSSIMGVVSRRFENLYTGGPDENYRIVPEYSIAEARVKHGKYEEAIDEYRQVIEEHPTDILPHLRIAELALKHLRNAGLAELELTTAMAKAVGEDSLSIAAGRLADLYQHELQEPARALRVMTQLREKIPGTKQAALAEERIAVLTRIAHHGEEIPKAPGKITSRPSRFRLTED